jgi:hypothetical protein
MKRMILVLTLTAMMLATALPALAQNFNEESGKTDDSGEPRAPSCDWYYFDETRQYDAWWEYWCHYRGWGWEFVLWTWA